MGLGEEEEEEKGKRKEIGGVMYLLVCGKIII